MSVLESLRKTFSFDDDYETFREDIDKEVETPEDNVINPPFFRRKEKETLRALPVRESHPHEEAAALNIVKPERFEDAMDIVNNIRSGQIIVINTSLMELKTAQRLLDFISGSTFALDGDIQEVMECVYVVTPAGVAMKNNVRSESVMKNLFGLK
jgi:cell division inhibitor SepF